MRDARRLGRRRAGRRASSARVARTGSGSRSRSRTAACARSRPALAEFLRAARPRDRRARRRSRSRTRRGEVVGEVGVAGAVTRAVEIVRLPQTCRSVYRIRASMVRAGGEASGSLRSEVLSPSTARESEVHAHRRYRPARGRGAAEARRARTGEGLPHLRRDRRRPRGGRAHEGAGRGLLHLPDRPLDRAGRGGAAQDAAARAAGARRGREGRAEARPHRRAVARLAAALPPRDRQGAAADRRPGGLRSRSGSSAATCSRSRR